MFVVRFNNYGKYGLLCGADGIPHLMVNGDQRHWGEFITPGLLFLYIAGWIGLVGRRSYLIAISVSSQETSDERDHHWCTILLQAQTEAINLLCGAKTQVNSIPLELLNCPFYLWFRGSFCVLRLQSNPENTVGMLTMVGKELEFWLRLPLILARFWHVCTVCLYSKAIL